LAVVATEYGSLVMPELPSLSVHEGRLSLEEITELVGQYDEVVDATHPYARIISENIAEAAKRCGKTAIRLVRPSLEYGDVLEFSSITEACAYLNSTTGNILATTGSKELLPYSSIENYKDRVFIRVLATAEAIQACTQAGFSATNIICMQGPFSETMNLATMEQIDARYMVTKDTGRSGGFLEKITAARELGVKVVLVGRPCREEGLTLEETLQYFENKFGSKKGSCAHFPMFYDLRNKKIVVVGGGEIATRRIKVLRRFGAEIVVIAPRFSENLMLMTEVGPLMRIEREYRSGDLEGAMMALAATDDREVNEKVYFDAREAGIPVNVCDKKEQCDFYFPAVFENESIVGGLISKDGDDHHGAKEMASSIREWLLNGRGRA
jgi:precorrin-2 dehydrogenase/sirohydrochlorin ferrochelatase/precorrin-6A/cobalt-precorrin-6A reductase